MKAFSLVLLAACAGCTILVKEARPEALASQGAPLVERKLVDYTNSTNPSLFLDLVKPEGQQSGVLEAESKRLLYLRRMDRWLTKLQSKLDRVKFITKTRLSVLNDNLHVTYRAKGFHPIIKYHRLYNQMMNPVVNPYLQMNINNNLMASPEAHSDPAFQSFQAQLHDYANSYANSIAEFNSGLFYDSPKPDGSAVGLSSTLSNNLSNSSFASSLANSLSNSQLYASLAAKGSGAASSLGGTNVDVSTGSGFADISVTSDNSSTEFHSDSSPAHNNAGGMV